MAIHPNGNPLDTLREVLSDPGKSAGIGTEILLPVLLAALGGRNARGLGEIPGMASSAKDIGSQLMTSGANRVPGSMGNAGMLAELAKTIGGIMGKVGGVAAPMGAAAGMIGNPGDTGAPPQQIQPGDSAIQTQMQSLVAAGLPASAAWKRINGDQPLDPSQQAAWGAAYANAGGINDYASGPVAGVDAAGPPAPAPAAGAATAAPGAPAPAAGGTGAVDFRALSPQDQERASMNDPVVGGPAAGPTPAPAGGGVPTPTPTATPPAGPPPAGGPPTVGAAAAGAPNGNVPSPELSSYMYDLMNPERASQNAIGTTGGPQFGPGYDWLKSYLQPAFLHNLAGGNLTPGGLQGALQSRLGGTEQDTAAGTVGALKGFESQGKQALAGNPGSDLRTLMDRAKAGDTTARDQLTSKYGGMGYMSFLGTQDPGQMGGALAQAIAGDSSRPMAPGLAGVLGNYLGQILTKQVNSGLDVGPNANNRFGYLSGLLGY